MHRAEEEPELDRLAQAELEQATSEEIRRLLQELQTLMKSEGWDLLVKWIDQKLKKSMAVSAMPAARMASMEGGEGAIDGVLSREFRAGVNRGMLDVQGLPERLTEFLKQELEDVAKKEREEEETWDDED